MLSYEYMYYYCGLIYHINIIFRSIHSECFSILLHFITMFVWYLFLNSINLLLWLLFSGPASCLRKRNRHGWVSYIDTMKIIVLRFVWHRLVYIQYSYYRKCFCSERASRLHNFHHHVWVRCIDTTNITVWCMSSLLLSIDLQLSCYSIMFHFKLTNVAMVKWWMIKWCIPEIKIRIGNFFSKKLNLFICCGRDRRPQR